MDENRLKQLMQPVDLILTYDLEKLRREDEIKRAALWNQVKSSEAIFEREFIHELSPQEKAEKASEFTLARLLLATAAQANGEKSPIIKRFSQTELDLVSNFERFNVFDILALEEIADRMARRKDIYNLAMSFYRNEYARLDSILEAPQVQKDLKIAFNRRYRDRLDKVAKGVQAYIAKYGFSETVGQVENAIRSDGTAGKKPETAAGIENVPPGKEVKKAEPVEPKEKKWWKLDRLRLILSIAVLVVTLLGLLGWQFWPLSCSEKSYTLITQSIPGDMGSIQISPLPKTNGKYNLGTRVTLEERHNDKYEFIRWSGDSSGTMSSIVITMDRDKSIIAEFQKKIEPLPQLSTSVNPPGSGSVSPASGSYNAGTSVTLTESSNPGYRFASWSGDASGTSPTITITMDRDKNVVANFVRQYTLSTSLNPPGSGTINLDPPGGKYDSGTKVTLSPIPASGYNFSNWGGDASGSQNPVTMDRDKSVTATFVRQQFILTTSVYPPGSGTINLDPPGGKYDSGTKVTLAPFPASGYNFSNWGGDASGSQNPVTMDRDKSVTATFVRQQFILTTSVYPPGSGTINLDPPGGKYDSGTKVTLAPIPASGYNFSNWGGDASGSQNPVTMDRDKSVTATFVRQQFILTTSIYPPGSGNVSPASGSYDAGTSVTLTESPNLGYRFASWSVDASGTSTTIPILMNSNKTVTANFAPLPQQIQLKMGGAVAGISTYSIEFSNYLDAGARMSGSVEWQQAFFSGWKFDIYDPQGNLAKTWSGKDLIYPIDYPVPFSGQWKIKMTNLGDVYIHYGVMNIIPTGWRQTQY